MLENKEIEMSSKDEDEMLDENKTEQTFDQTEDDEFSPSSPYRMKEKFNLKKSLREMPGSLQEKLSVVYSMQKKLEEKIMTEYEKQKAKELKSKEEENGNSNPYEGLWDNSFEEILNHLFQIYLKNNVKVRPVTPNTCIALFPICLKCLIVYYNYLYKL